MMMSFIGETYVEIHLSFLSPENVEVIRAFCENSEN
jgi:hypothetical protein